MRGLGIRKPAKISLPRASRASGMRSADLEAREEGDRLLLSSPIMDVFCVQLELGPMDGFG
jgi:hypothetical protein